MGTSRCNRRRRLNDLGQAIAVPLSKHLKDQISRERDRLQLLLEQIKASAGRTARRDAHRSTRIHVRDA
jgi:hypothetical protein